MHRDLCAARAEAVHRAQAEPAVAAGEGLQDQARAEAAEYGSAPLRSFTTSVLPSNDCTVARERR